MSTRGRALAGTSGLRVGPGAEQACAAPLRSGWGGGGGSVWCGCVGGRVCIAHGVLSVGVRGEQWGSWALSTLTLGTSEGARPRA